MSQINKKVLITGVRGQDGTYLAEHLVNQGYMVIGTSHIEEGLFKLPNLSTQIEIRKLDLSNEKNIKKLVAELLPVEIYNLAARSSSSQLFDDPIATAQINGFAAVAFLEAIKEITPGTRYCQASSSEIFAGSLISPQDESTPYRPINAYGAAKAYANNIVHAYRKQHGLYATNAILYNHESPRRSFDYVTRKITKAAASIALGMEKELLLGNLESTRDWGFAGDYVRALCMIMQQQSPEDYVIASGVSHSVREFCEIAFSHLGLNYQDYVRVNPKWISRVEQTELRGNPAKLKNLGWRPSVGFSELVKMMVDADLEQLKYNKYK